MTILRSPVHTGVVVATVPLTARMRRVTVVCEAFRGLELRPAQDVELHLREPAGRRVKRRYTIRHARPDVGELDLDVLLHGEGAGSEWGRTAAPGDTVELQGPRGKLELHPAPAHLLCGDESALPAIAAICEALDEPRTALVEVGSAGDELPVRADVRWAHRDGCPPGTPEPLLAVLAGLDVRPDTHAYLMGETRSMVALRAELKSRGLTHFFVKGYWNLPRRTASPPV